MIMNAGARYFGRQHRPIAFSVPQLALTPSMIQSNCRQLNKYTPESRQFIHIMSIRTVELTLAISCLCIPHRVTVNLISINCSMGHIKRLQITRQCKQWPFSARHSKWLDAKFVLLCLPQFYWHLQWVFIIYFLIIISFVNEKCNISWWTKNVFLFFFSAPMRKIIAFSRNCCCIQMFW